jgi:DNA/RNA-binding domain of Phe-tRNA-synthetase-like protein
VLADDLGAFGSPTSDSERTAITPATRRLLMILFGFGDGVDIQAPLGRAAELLARFAVADDMETRVLRGA